MAKIYCKSSYLVRKDTAENWQNKNPILRKGEQGLETDTGIIKIGDGTTEYNSLPDNNVYLPKSRTEVNQSYDPLSENAQSGVAVSEAINSVKFPIKTYAQYFSNEGQTLYDINLGTDTGTYYVVHSVNVRTASGEEILCDVDIHDAENSGSAGYGDVTVRLSEPVVPIIIRIMYTEGVV